MILEPAYKMHQITSECIDSCEIDDNIAQGIKERAKQGEFTYWIQGELDELTKQKLQCMRYTIDIKHICDKIITAEDQGKETDLYELLRLTDSCRTAISRILSLPYGVIRITDITIMRDLCKQIHQHWPTEQ